MILVNLASSWPAVTDGQADAADITLGNWAQISDHSLDTYADSILGIYKNEVVTAFDITGWQRLTEGPDAGRVAFTGRLSQQWKHLIGTPNPGTPWTAGMARPVQYLDTYTLIAGTATLDPTEDDHDHRTDLRGYTLTVHSNGNATVGVPFGKHVTVVPSTRVENDWQFVDEDDDAAFRAAFDQVTPADWHQLSVLLNRIETHDGPLHEIVSREESPGVMEWPHSVDSPVIADLRWLLRRAGLILHFAPVEWEIGDASTATPEDCVRALTLIARNDHWITGGFVSCFENPDSVGRAYLRRAFELAGHSN
ncbi:DUF6508 domain-containing protein [Rhodococcus yananensis]|uniref:DUF6508 domain-containing protein n=1 Tax=Rhodococcus yananensis TaxID=2879464 RepID=UPI001CF8D608|nr:DUF6508 domain-containing protein [Rhodococcus yananensis]